MPRPQTGGFSPLPHSDAIRVVDQYRSGKITLEDLGRILDELAKSPVMQNIMIYAIEKQYVDPSGLPDEEKQAARLTLQRILRGIHEKRIEEGELDAALDHLSAKTQDGQRQMKNRVTDEELRRFLAECRRVADRAGVPVEPFEIKISEEFRNAVERAMPSLPKPEASASGNVSSKPEASASGNVSSKPEASANRDAPPKPAASAGEDVPRPSSPDPATMPLEREDATTNP